MPLEATSLSGVLAGKSGVRVFLLTLASHANAAQISVGPVCGGRVAAVHLGVGLDVHAVTLEADELDDVGVARQKALAFLQAL